MLCPYPGLRSFNEKESLYFKGREGHVEEVIAKLEQNKFLLVTGASGDGKSSLIFAGLIPNCRAGFFKSQFSKWTVVSFRPERTPLKNMSAEFSTHFKKEKEKIEENLQLGYSALVEEYKQSPLFVDINEDAYKILSEENQKEKRKEASNLLIIVDQFEELFTNVENFNKETSTPTHQTQLLNNLILETTRIARKENLPIYIICTMRSDYLGQCAALDGFPELIVESQFYLTRLKRRDIIQVIDEPAMLSGNSITERLMQRLLNDIRAGRDVLPVLQHCLSRIWHAASMGKEEMDLIHYAMVGGMGKEQLPQEDQLLFEEWFIQQPGYKQAYFKNPGLHNVLNIHADELYEKSKGSIIETVFKCLTKIDDNRAIRNLMTLQEITEMLGKEKYTTDQVAETLKIFREQGNTLIRPFIEVEQQTTNHLQPATVLDITHEALIRNWKRLEEWSKQEYESVQMYREFRSQLDKWKNNNKQKNYLMSVGSLSYYNDNWFKPQKSDPQSWLKRYMWQEGEEVHDKETKAKAHFEEIKEYLHRSKKNITRKKIFAQVAVAAIVLLLIGVSIGYYRSDQLNQQIQKTGEANRLATRAYMELEKDPTLSFRLAEAAYSIEPTPLAKQILMAAYGEVPFYMKLEGHTGGGCTIAKYSDDGNIVASLTGDEIVKIWDANTYQLISEGKGHKGAHGPNPNSLNISPNSKYIVSASTDSTVRIWDLEGKCLAILKHDGPVNSAYFSPLPVSAMQDLPEFKDIASKNPQGEYLVLTASIDKTARLWDMEGKELVRFVGHSKGIPLAKFTPDCKYVLTISGDTTARIWNFKGQILTIFNKHTHQLYDVNFSYDSKYFIITSSKDKTARVWSIDGKEMLKLVGHDVNVWVAEFSQDGQHILTASDDLSIKVWDRKGNVLATMTGHTSNIWNAHFSPDSKKIISASDDGTARLWNLEGTELMLFKGHTSQVMSANFSPDGKYVVTASGDGTARIWNVEMKENPVFRGHTAYVNDINISEKKDYIVTSGWDYSTILWKFNGTPFQKMIGHEHYAVLTSLILDEYKIITSSYGDGTIKLWNLSGKELHTMKGHDAPIWKVFHNNKTILSVSSGSYQTMVWDTAGKLLQAFKNESCIAYSKAGNFTINVAKDTTLSILKFDPEADTLPYSTTVSYKSSDFVVTDAAFSNDIKYFITTTEDSTLWFWDLYNYISSKGNRNGYIFKKKINTPISNPQFSPSDNFFFVIGKNNKIIVYDITGDSITTLIGHSDEISDANFSSDGKHIVSGAFDNTIRIWDLKGIELQAITNHTSKIKKAKFIIKDNYILSCSNDQTARLTPWRVEDVLHKINTEKVRGEVWQLKEKDKEVYGIK